MVFKMFVLRVLGGSLYRRILDANPSTPACHPAHTSAGVHLLVDPMLKPCLVNGIRCRILRTRSAFRWWSCQWTPTRLTTWSPRLTACW